MKKIIVVLFFLTIISICYNESENILIPKESIRFRIIANSDSAEDQKLKLTIRNDLESELYDVVKSAETIDEARDIISKNINKVDSVLKKYNVDYKINYGNNYFPPKEYKGITYEEGKYESLVITLGEGIGHNWWCVLFPPLCKIDLKDNLDDASYKFFVTEYINKVKDK